MKEVSFDFIQDEKTEKMFIKELNKVYDVQYQKGSAKNDFLSGMKSIVNNNGLNTDTLRLIFGEENGGDLLNMNRLYIYIMDYVMVRLAHDLSEAEDEKESIPSSITSSSQFSKRYKNDDLIIENDSVRFKEFISEVFGISIEEEGGRISEDKSSTQNFCIPLQGEMFADNAIGCFFPHSVNNNSTEITRFSLPVMSKCFTKIYTTDRIKECPETMVFFEELFGYRLAVETFELLMIDQKKLHNQRSELSREVHRIRQRNIVEEIAHIEKIATSLAVIPFPDARIAVMKKALVMYIEQLDDFLEHCKSFFDIENLYECINYVWIDLVEELAGGFGSNITEVKKVVLRNLRNLYFSSRFKELKKYSERNMLRVALDLWRSEYNHPLQILARNKSMVEIYERVYSENKTNIFFGEPKIDLAELERVIKLKGEPMFFDKKDLNEYPPYILRCFTDSDRANQQEFIKRKWKVFLSNSKKNRRRIMMSGEKDSEWIYAAIQNAITYSLLSNF